MTATAAQHAAHLDVEQAEGDECGRWPEGLPLEVDAIEADALKVLAVVKAHRAYALAHGEGQR